MRATKIYNNSSELHEILAQLNLHKHVAYDIETTGLSPRRDSIIGFSIATESFAAYVVLKAWEGGQLVTKISYDEVKPVLAALTRKRLLGWNFSFDSRFTLAQTGINLAPSLYADGMLLLHTTDENRFSYGLKQVGKEIFGESAASEQKDMLESIKMNGGTEKQYYMADSQLMAKYGIQDAILTYELCKKFNKQLDTKLANLYFDEVIPTYKHVIIPMEFRGMPVNVPYMQSTLQEINADISAIEDSIQAQIAPLLTNFNEWYISTKYPFKLSGQFKEVLGEKIAPAGWPKTPAGTISLNAQAIEKAKKKGELTADSQFERYVKQLERIPQELIHQVQLELLRREGTKYTFNLASKDHLKRLFFGTSTTKSVLNERPLSKTDKGNPQVDSDFLEVMAKKYKWAEELLVYNSLLKIRGTYIERFLESQEDGIFYPQYFMHRTVSGRLSGDLQQMPRPISDEAVASGEYHLLEQKYTNRIRHFFQAKDGYLFIDNDYESLEPHVFAHVANDPALIDIFEKGNDFYSTIAIAAEGLKQYSADKKADNYLGKLNKDARQKAKAYALGISYGLGPFALSKHLNCSEHEAKKIYTGYLNGFPELKKWMDRTQTLVFNQGYIETEFGRRRRFQKEMDMYHANGRDILFEPLELWQRFHDMPATYERMKSIAGQVKNARNNSYNFQIQGLSAHIVNRAAINIAKELQEKQLDAYICMQVHDELVLYCNEQQKEQAAEIMQRQMETSVPLRLKLKAVPSFGKTYAESKG